MSAFSVTPRDSHRGSRPLDQSRRIANVRAVLALAWAVALITSVGGDVPTTASDLAVGVAALLASYPLIDLFASIAGARYAGTSRNVLGVNAAVSAVRLRIRSALFANRRSSTNSGASSAAINRSQFS